MISASTQMQFLLVQPYRIPVVEVCVQYPNPNNTLQQGAQLMLDCITDIRIIRNQEPSSDSLDITIIAPDNRYSPLRGSGIFSLYS
jgi:hypothetical protein